MKNSILLAGMAVGLSVALSGCGGSSGQWNLSSLELFEDSLAEVIDGYKENDDGEIAALAHEDFVRLLKVDTATMTYPFERLWEEGYFTALFTSDDRNVRLYEWKRPTAWFRYPYTNEYVTQFRSSTGVYVYEEDLVNLAEEVKGEDIRRDPNYSSLSSFRSFRRTDGSMLYLVEIYDRVDTQWGQQTLVPFYIDGDQLRGAAVFENEDGELSTFYSLEYGNIADWYFRTDGMGWDWVTYVDEESGDLYVPAHGYLDDRYKVMHFDGTVFRLINEDAGGSWINPALRDFGHLAQIFQTEDFLVRIDEVGDGLYRYASWEAGQTMTDEPSLVLYGDECDEENETYTFRNGDYTYAIVNVGEEGETKEKFLVVKEGDREILRQEQR